MNSNTYSNQIQTRDLMVAAILIAVGILIPMFMPIKVVLGPASYTLASHLPIFLGMFLSPFIGLSVALGTTLGFWFGGFPIVIVLRALSHVGFVALGAYWIQKTPQVLQSRSSRLTYSVILNMVHAFFEMIAVFALTAIGPESLTGSFWSFLFIFVGLGTFIHGMVDFYLAYFLAQSLQKHLHWNFVN